jgi:hypothetical protein
MLEFGCLSNDGFGGGEHEIKYYWSTHFKEEAHK